MPLPYFDTFQRRYNDTISSNEHYFRNFSYVDSAYSKNIIYNDDFYVEHYKI